MGSRPRSPRLFADPGRHWRSFRFRMWQSEEAVSSLLVNVALLLSPSGLRRSSDGIGVAMPTLEATRSRRLSPADHWAIPDSPRPESAALRQQPPRASAITLFAVLTPCGYAFASSPFRAEKPLRFSSASMIIPAQGIDAAALRS